MKPFSVSGTVADNSKFELLWEDSERSLYRILSDGAKCDRYAFMAGSSAAEHPSPESINRLKHEHGLKDYIDGAWAVRPLELTREWGRTMLLVEYPGGDRLDKLTRSPMEVGLFLQLAVALSAALRRLHERGLIHKDIKPANVIVNSATGQAWLTGFGVATRLPRERQAPEPPEFIAGTLAYMAPEQTGRVNRSIDSRSDLYSLGVTFYEMLTGTLPFTASDPMEWVHCHIARQPDIPSERLRNIPAAVSAITMKLLSKTVEERYQTAAGVQSDLRLCLSEWETHGSVQDFPLGAQDTPDRLMIPEKLYGRDREVDTLLAAFDRIVAGGRPELMLVSGYSGIGKSSVVNELHKVLVPPRGLFASGKFDQYMRNVPYATLAQAFRSLIRPLLSKSEAELCNWREALQEALGPNGSLIADLVPELKLIIGEQPPVPSLPPQEAQRRFQLVFRRFISVFARPEHPLALFLDDLQWLDEATLGLLEDLLTSSDLQHLMLIGAYRDNEVDSAHPLWRKLDAIRQTGARVHEIVLAPLTFEDLGRLLVDSLHCEPERVTPLAQLVHEKTAANPFFAIQFISALADEGLLTFDHSAGRWAWDLDRIHAKGYTENVVDLMVGKLNRLPLETQKALQEFACLGNSAEITTLSIVHGTSEEEVHLDLWEAVRLEFIVRLERSYRFVHDRVQEAAYSLTPEQLRAESHLRIGRLLNAHTSPEKRDEAIFEIVNQLNRGAALTTSQEERDQIAELDLVAGKRAEVSTAYASALNYLIAGAALLADDSWERRHELTFALELHRAECEFLTGELAAAEERLTILSSRAANTVEQSSVTCLRVDLYTTLDQSDRAVDVGLDYLRYLGVEWSPHPPAEEGRREYERIWKKLGGRAIEQLIDLPLMSDPASLATMDVLTKVSSPALFTDANLFSLVICRAVNLSLEHGSSDGSTFAYVYLGIIAGPHFGNYQAGFRFGQLGYELVEKRGLNRFQVRTYVSFANMVMPWTKHVNTSRDLLRRAFDEANKIGDLTFAAYSRADLGTNLLAAGDPLAEVQREAEDWLEFAQKARFGLVIDRITGNLGLIRTLRGLTHKFGSFDDEQFDELRFERHLAGNPALALPECFYWIRKLQARWFAGDYASAVDASLRAQQLLWTASSFFEMAEYHFYGALAQAASWGSAAADQRQRHFEALFAHHRQLEVWAENCPENFENRAALVGAEIARIEGRSLDAMDLYEQAVRSSHANGFIHNEALANELAARFYAARGFATTADAYLRNARACYEQWGALGKVDQIDASFPHIKVTSASSTLGATIETPVKQLDAETVIKASQTLSSEMNLPSLIEKLLRLAVEHAGAQRGLLILLNSDGPYIEAEAKSGHGSVEIVTRHEQVTSVDLPQSALQYVLRTRKPVLLDDASSRQNQSEDEYMRSMCPKSVLCIPILKQAKVIGALYLENNLTAGAFTSGRVALLEVLASQAAISLENARLYSDLGRSEALLAEAQHLSSTGSFLWRVSNDSITWSKETRHIFDIDQSVPVTFELAMSRVHPEDDPPLRQFLDRARAEGGHMDYEFRLLLPNDSVKRLHLVAHATRDQNGQLEYIGAIQDVSERRVSEEALTKTRSELAHVSRVVSLGELTASIAHEVNQPLTAIATNASVCLELLQDSTSQLKEVQNALAEIVDDADRASAVLARVRQLVRKAPYTRTLLNLRDVVAEVLVLARNEFAARHVAILTELAEDLPPVTGDRVQIQQVLLNLVVNGMDAMSSTEESKRAVIIGGRTEIGEGEPVVVVSVLDSGIGLKPEEMDRLFEAFYTTKPQGMGMGLAISRSIIEAHDGRLWAEPNQGAGATFLFSLPVAGSAPS
jgi:predicted ATPase/signal transduction histidine kinase